MALDAILRGERFAALLTCDCVNTQAYIHPVSVEQCLLLHDANVLRFKRRGAC